MEIETLKDLTAETCTNNRVSCVGLIQTKSSGVYKTQAFKKLEYCLIAPNWQNTGHRMVCLEGVLIANLSIQNILCRIAKVNPKLPNTEAFDDCD